MSLARGAAIIGGTILVALLQRSKTSDHDRLLKKTYKRVRRGSSSEVHVYTDHINPDDDAGNPDGVLDGVNGVPDLILHGYRTSNLVVEVEDGDGLTSPSRVKSQLRDFRKQGFKRVLVVPDDSASLTAGRRIAEQVEGSVVVTTPSGITDHL